MSYGYTPSSGNSPFPTLLFFLFFCIILLSLDFVCHHIYSFNSTENSNLNEDSLDIGLQSGATMDDSLSGFNLIQAVTAVGQSSVAAASESNKRQAEKTPLMLGTSDSEVGLTHCKH